MGSCKSVPCEDDCCDHETITLYGTGNAVYGPWLERKGDYIIVTADFIDEFDSGELEVRAFTKTKEDRGNGTQVDVNTSIMTTQAGRRKSVEWNPGTGIGLKELVRLGYRNRTNATSSWIMFRMLENVWFDAVKA